MIEIFRNKSFKVLSICIAASFGAHAVALFIFYKNPLLLHPSLRTLFAKTTAMEIITGEADDDVDLKSQTLDEVFSHFTVAPHQTPYDAKESALDLLNQPITEEVESDISLNPSPAKELSQELSLSAPSLNIDEGTSDALFIEDEVSSIALPVVVWDKPEVLDHLSDIALSSPEFDEEFEDFSDVEDGQFYPALIPDAEKGLALLPDHIQVPSKNLELQPLPQIKSKSEKTKENYPLVFAKPFHSPIGREKKISLSPSSLKSYLSSEDLIIDTLQTDFSTDVQILPRKGKGILFSVKLEPTDELIPSLKQNFYFLIDRTNSIEKHRYNVFKRAVLRALSALGPEDTFNIYIFDKKVVRLSEKNLPNDDESIALAETFLEKEDHTKFFSAGDIYTLLEKIIPQSVPEEDVNTAILISDGNTLLKNKEQRRVLNNWMEKNKGRVSLYAAAVGKNNNLNLLDFISTFNKGKLLYSDTHAAFPRKLTQFIYDLREPIAKDIVITATTSDPNVNIEIFPASARLPNFHSHQPYTIVGMMDRPCDVTLTIQGKHLNQWLNVEKTISFSENARRGTKALERKWSTEQAYVRFERFLKDGKTAHLDEAKTLLQPNYSRQ